VRAPAVTFPLSLCLLVGCGAADPTASWVAGTGPLAAVTGRAALFGPRNGLTLDGATVSVAEAPQHRATVAADGSFSLQVPSGRPLSFLVEQPGFHPNQSATLAIDAQGIAMLGFQVPTEDTVGSLAVLAALEPDPTRCQVATTVSRKGTAPYGGPGLGEPAYFAYASDSFIYPDPALGATSIDGGVIIANLPVGEYTLTATKPGKQFSPVAIRCRAGVLVNAAPPHGLEEL